MPYVTFNRLKTKEQAISLASKYPDRIFFTKESEDATEGQIILNGVSYGGATGSEDDPDSLLGRLVSLENKVAEYHWIPITGTFYTGTSKVSNTTILLGNSYASQTFTLKATQDIKSYTLTNLDDSAVATTDNPKELTVTIPQTSAGSSATDNLKTYTVTIKDEYNKTADVSFKVITYNEVRWGTSTNGSPTINSSFIASLSQSSIQNSKGITRATNYAFNGSYLYIAIPSRLATSINLKAPHTSVVFETLTPVANNVSYTNSAGFTESYNVFRSTNLISGSTTFKVE